MRWLMLLLVGLCGVSCSAGQAGSAMDVAGIVDPRVDALLEPVRRRLASLGRRADDRISWLDLLYMATGISVGTSGVAAVGLHQYRNRTRRRALADLNGEGE